MNKSQNGWDASKVRAEIDIDSFPVPGTSIKLTCNKAVAPLLVGFAAEFHLLIEPIDEGSLDDWGWCYREVRGSQTVLSNHASGTAVDLNAKIHPLGKAGTFPLQKVAMIQALARKYGLRWGGDYTGRKDEMHFEIALSQAKVAKLIGSLDKGEIK